MPAPDAILLGRLAVERGLADHETVSGRLRAIGIEGDADALAAGLADSVGAERQGQLDELATVAKQAQDRALIGDPRPFGAIAVALGGLTPQALEEAVSSQASLRARGIVKRLGALLVARGDLPPAAVRDVLKAQGQVIFSCADCGSRFNVLGAAGTRPNCPLCAKSTIPTQPGDAVEVEGTLVAAPATSRRTTPRKIRSRSRSFRAEVAETKGFAGYTIEHEIARGGMGIVYKARTASPESRAVALKVLLAGEGASQDMIDRLYAEAEAAAKLRHPNIVTVHNVGVHEHSHFICMDFISGEPLEATLKRQGRLSPKRAAQITLALAEALHYAHRHGIVHRDLKPANVMLEEDGRPILTDFGLAKDLVVDKGLTAASAVLGTPDYMSPEQARGNSRKIDPRSDVFALGALLYHMLDGHPPFAARTPMKTMDNVLRHEPPPPSRDNPAVPRELDAVVRKALEKRPGDRYQEAAGLARDLQRWLDGDAVAATAPSAWRDFWRRLRRDSRLQQLLAVAIAAAVLGSVITFILTYDGADSARSKQHDAQNKATQDVSPTDPHESRIAALSKVIGSRLREAKAAEESARRADVGEFALRRTALRAAYQHWHELGQLLDEDEVAREAVGRSAELRPARQVTTRKLALQRALSAVDVDEATARGAGDEGAQAAFDAAIQDLEKAIDLDAENGRAFSLRAWLRAVRLWPTTTARPIPAGEINRIEFDCRKALSADARDLQALAARALLRANQGRFEDALLLCAEADRAAIGRPQPTYVRGYTMYYRSATESKSRTATLEAAASALETARLAAHDERQEIMQGRAAVLLAKVLDQLGRRAQSHQVLNKYLLSAPAGSPAQWHGEGRFIRGYLREGTDIEGAKSDYRAIPREHRRHPEAKARLKALGG